MNEEKLYPKLFGILIAISTIDLIRISKCILDDVNIVIILHSNCFLELKDLGDDVSGRISEFVQIFDDALTLISERFSNQLIPKGQTRNARLSSFIQSMGDTEGALDKFGKWIKANQEIAEYIRAFLENLSKSSNREDDFVPRIKLFVIPLFKDIIEALDTLQKFALEIGDLLPMVRRIVEGHDQTLHSIAELLEFVGYKSSEHSSDVEDFFEALTSNEPEKADSLLEKIRGNHEKLKQKVGKNFGVDRNISLEEGT
ncbi:MAG: hypothetical protein ACFE7S_04210 [Candidatus Hodarchaeota archaeon]